MKLVANRNKKNNPGPHIAAVDENGKNINRPTASTKLTINPTATTISNPSFVIFIGMRVHAPKR
ncbi:hypothetical protein BN7874_105 [Phage NCTB]|nr:hypothetical protein BN7874_105 [Phage NCTB]